MNEIWKNWSVNFDLPGCVELENPNWFIENIRPIEEFKHTPNIPISDSEMKWFKKW